jgi:hypothetical protein
MEETRKRLTGDFTQTCVTQEAWLTLPAFSRIQTWALEEARRRLESEGILEDPNKKK